jgi:hypothetical protein
MKNFDNSSVEAVAVLDEEFRQQQRRRRGDRDLVAIDGDDVVAEPVVRHGDGAVGHGEDHVEEMLVVLPDLGDPALVLDVGAVTARLEISQDAGIVPGLAEHVQILGRPADPRVRRHRIGARQQERNTAFLQQLQALLVEDECVGGRMIGRIDHRL